MERIMSLIDEEIDDIVDNIRDDICPGSAWMRTNEDVPVALTAMANVMMFYSIAMAANEDPDYREDFQNGYNQARQLLGSILLTDAVNYVERTGYENRYRLN